MLDADLFSFIPLAQPEACLIRQTSEQRPSKPQVIGSSPIGNTICKCGKEKTRYEVKIKQQFKEYQVCWHCYDQRLSAEAA